MPFLLSQLIEAARWTGALAVLALHVNNLFVNQADIMSAPHAAPAYVWWFFTGTVVGHEAVVGFFVLSGWLVGGRAVAQVAAGQDFLRNYYIHRVTRIYVVLIPALLVTFLLDSVGRVSFADVGVYDRPMFQGHFTLPVFLANLANLQSIVADYFGTNGPLWSLACEFWYYITFPGLILIAARNYPFWLRAWGFVLGVTLAAALCASDSWFKYGFIIWIMGALAHHAPRPLIGSRTLSLVIFAAALVAIRLLLRGPLLAEHPWTSYAADLLSAALFVNVMLAFRDGGEEGFFVLRSARHARFAAFSYSLYAIHMPIVIFASAVVGRALGRDWALRLATLENYAVALAVLSVTIALAAGFARLTESRTGAARRALDQMIPTGASAQRRVVPEKAPSGS